MGNLKYDELIATYLGQFGKYQRIHFCLVPIPVLFVSMQALAWTFTGATLDYRCQYPGENSTHPPFDDIFTLFNGSEVKAIKQGDFQCKRYSQVNLLSDLPPGNASMLPSEKCDSWKYDHSEITNSAINRFNIVCDDFWYRAMIQSVYYIGQAFGSVTFGWIGDHYGRKVAFILAITILSFSGTLMAIVPWMWAFVVLRILVGFCHTGVFVMSIAIGMELAGPKKRSIGGIATGFVFAMGQLLLAGLSYNIRDYQHLQLVISAPCFLFIAYWWIIPESTRWLVSRGRRKDADKILKKIARVNGRHLPEGWWYELDRGDGSNYGEKTEGAKVKKYTYLDIFRYPVNRRRAIIQFASWPMFSMVYLGISMNPSFLGGNRYATFALGAMAEVAGIVLAAFVINPLGRKLSAIIGTATSGILLGLTLTMPESAVVVKICLITATKIAITMTYIVEATWSQELFPTVIRSQAVGLCAMFSRIGGIAASYLIMYIVESYRTLVVYIFAGFSIGAAALSVLQSETGGAALMETLEDAEQFGKEASWFSFRAPEPISPKKHNILLGTKSEFGDDDKFNPCKSDENIN